MNETNFKLQGGGGFSQLENSINTINHNILALHRQLNFIQTLLLKNSSLNAIFDSIYETNLWGNGSGSGSKETLNQGYVAFLQNFMRESLISSLVDVGCGDWQFSKNIDFSNIYYTGYDVASFVINANNAKYAKDNITFEHYDGDFSQIKSADLLLCKDVLQHLPTSKIHEFISILPKFKYALITNDIANKQIANFENKQIAPGQYRPLDLRKAPFNLNLEPVFMIKRMPAEPDICVMLYKNEKF